MTRPTQLEQFFTLVQRVESGTTFRSENDLSSKLAFVLNELGLHTVLDTRVSTGGRKRPDILGYASQQDADLVLPAEVIIEAKRPDEVEEFGSLAEAIVSDRFWHTKTYPYLRDNIARAQYFAFTTFNEFAVFPITQGIRNSLIASIKTHDSTCGPLRARIEREVISFRLSDQNRGPASAHAWVEWINQHLRPERIAPVPLSSTRNSIPISSEEELEQLASRLATFAAGSGDANESGIGLFQSIRLRLGNEYKTLAPEIQRDLLIFVMSQHTGLNSSEAESLLQEDVQGTLDDFVAASIHSLLSRLFAIKVIEDVFCLQEEQPLIEQTLWLFAIDTYDALSAEEIRTEVFHRIRAITKSANPVLRRFAAYGFFFDWIEEHIDPVLFRSLIEVFSIHDFTYVEGDLLGRFYELYAQQINRSRRKALGQYYTPIPIVQFMWRQAVNLVTQRGMTEHLTILDPAMGSGTFLAEGARVLGSVPLSHFWERLTGFDIAAQVLGIAHVNVYMAVLSQLTPDTALGVEDLRLYATDTLDYEHNNHLRQILPFIIDDSHRLFLEQRILISTEAKRQSSYRLVIGNPPYRNNSNLTLAQVAERFPQLLQSSVEYGGAQRRNIRDDYAWFVAAADYYIEDQGIICYILSDSFASHRSYEHFRSELLRHYHIRMLVRLGTNIFSDVGYRTAFAIILLEKRAVRVNSAEDVEPIPYSDLRSLSADTPQNDLGTNRDPRLIHLREVAKGNADLDVTTLHIPSTATRYSFYPSENAATRFACETVALHERAGERIFVTKWPGIITAFDVLFKGNTRAELEERLSSLFGLCRTSGLNSERLERILERWGTTQGFSYQEVKTLKIIGTQIQQSTLTFDSNKIKRSFSGSIPDDAHWYPPAAYVHYLYYEPSLNVPRNVNPGKPVGWGNMNQWRDPRSHGITPKLIYTTASRAQNGYAAFITDDEWYVKLHGGTSQQFNYTGLYDPIKSGRVDGLPNNLTDSGLALFRHFAEAGTSPDTLLYYIAGIWNSELASELLEEVGSAMRPGIRIPANSRELELALHIAKQAKAARDITRLIQLLGSGQGEIAVNVLDPWLNQSLVVELGFQRMTEGRRRFRAREVYNVPPDVNALLKERLEEIERQINSLVDALYP